MSASLPDLRALAALPFDGLEQITGLRNLREPKTAQKRLDVQGLWWAAPFAEGESGYTYALRLSPGPGHGAVLRCGHGHAVTLATSPGQALFAMLAVERLLVGESFRARLHGGWPQARGLVRDAVGLTGGAPDRLDAALHLADGLPNWVWPRPFAEWEQKRTALRKIIGEDPASPWPEAWSRAQDGLRAPDDAHAALRLLQGNHGLGGTAFCGGLAPSPRHAREALVACAKKVRDAGLPVADAWETVIEAIATKAEPRPAHFMSAVDPAAPDAWDALGAVSFWFQAVKRAVPPSQVTMAKKIAEAQGFTHRLEARRR